MRWNFQTDRVGSYCFELKFLKIGKKCNFESAGSFLWLWIRCGQNFRAAVCGCWQCWAGYYGDWVQDWDKNGLKSPQVQYLWTVSVPCPPMELWGTQISCLWMLFPALHAVCGVRVLHLNTWNFMTSAWEVLVSARLLRYRSWFMTAFGCFAGWVLRLSSCKFTNCDTPSKFSMLKWRVKRQRAEAMTWMIFRYRCNDVLQTHYITAWFWHDLVSRGGGCIEFTVKINSSLLLNWQSPWHICFFFPFYNYWCLQLSFAGWCIWWPWS